jgi:hypothetical protein
MYHTQIKSPISDFRISTFKKTDMRLTLDALQHQKSLNLMAAKPSMQYQQKSSRGRFSTAEPEHAISQRDTHRAITIKANQSEIVQNNNSAKI